MTTTPPTLTSREVNLAALATRALLDRLLAQAEVPFESWLVLSQVATAAEEGHDLPVAAVVERFTVDLGHSVDEVDAVRSAAVAADLVTPVGADHLAFTDRGRRLHAHISAQVADVVSRVYRDLSTDDLVIARRVIDTITERARVELKSLAAA
jgi:hypothetical protein